MALFQIILSLIINPFLLNKSRALLRETQATQMNSILKVNDFSDSFKGVTFYIDKKNSNDELINLFIKDINGSLNTSLSEVEKSNNTTIFSEKGIVVGNKLILFNGTIQTLNINRELKNIDFKKTELSLINFSTRTIKQPKIQETSSYILFQCLVDKNIYKDLLNCPASNNRKVVIEALSRRAGMPLYIPLISIIASFLLIYKKEKKNNFLKKYIIFIFAFTILIFAEILLKFTGFSTINFMLYFLSPLILIIILYSLLAKNMISERIK